LKRFDLSVAEFERAQAHARPAVQNILALLAAVVTPSR
jgi:hypothetical protein